MNCLAVKGFENFILLPKYYPIVNELEEREEVSIWLKDYINHNEKVCKLLRIFCHIDLNHWNVLVSSGLSGRTRTDIYKGKYNREWDTF